MIMAFDERGAYRFLANLGEEKCGRALNAGVRCVECGLEVRSSGFSRQGVDRLESWEYFQRRVFMSNALSVRHKAA
jgi:hypothetical protein